MEFGDDAQQVMLENTLWKHRRRAMVCVPQVSIALREALLFTQIHAGSK